MSLHVLANHMASKGRDGDSMLVHMTPHEVQGLQALAMKHGGSLTINPDTGLPEANFLKSLLPMLAGFALGPAGFGLVSSAMGAGAIVGGITGIATGSLSKGLMAGLGAYGGFGIGEGLAGAGADAMTRGALSAEGALPSIENITQVTGEGYGGSAANYSDQVNSAVKAARDASAAMPTSDLMSAGAKAAMDDPMGFAKQNWKPIAAAALPVLSAIGTTTPGPTASPMAPGRIREKRWDGRQFVDVANTDAGVYNTSGRSFSDLYRGYNTGGIVALARGGVPRYDGKDGSVVGGDDALAAYQAGNYAEANRLLGAAGMSAQDVVSKYGLSQADAATVAKNLGYAGDLSGLQYAAPPPVAQVATATAAPVVQAQTANTVAAAPTYNQYTNEQIGQYLLTNPTVDIAAATKATNADPAAVNAYIASLANPFVGSTDTKGGSGTLGIYNQMVAQGVDPNELYNSALANDPKYAGWSKEDITRGYQLDKGAYALSKQLNGVVSDKDWAKFMDDNKYSINDMSQAFGLSKDEVTRRYNAAKATQPVVCGAGFKLSADGKSCVPDTKGPITCGAGFKASADGLSCVRDTVIVTENTSCPSGSHWDSTTKMCVLNTSATQNTTTDVTTPTNLYTAPATSLPVGVSGNTGPSQVGGGATVNPNGTITTSPRIPDIPVGGFTGSKNLRDTYEKGGGNLGYTSPTFKTIEDFNAKYLERMSGDSRAAYDYLTGKGGAKYPVKSGVGQIARPYDEAVLGYPARGNLPYIYNKTTGKMDVNPDYVAPGRNAAGDVTYSMSLNDVKKSLTDAPLSGQALYDWAKSNNLSAQQIADATGRSLSSVYADFRAGSKAAADTKAKSAETAAATGNYDLTNKDIQPPEDSGGSYQWSDADKKWIQAGRAAAGGLQGYAMGGYAIGGGLGSLGSYSDGGRLLKGPGDGVSDSIPATIGNKQQPARLADGEFVVPARIVSELGNGSTEAGAKKLYAMMDRVQRARGKTTGKNKVAANSRADKYLPA